MSESYTNRPSQSNSLRPTRASPALSLSLARSLPTHRPRQHPTMMDLSQHPSVKYDEPLFPKNGDPIRAVLLGQHPSRVTALAEMINEEGLVRVVAGVSDILDCGVVLNAQIPKVDLLVCGGYFELVDVRDMLAEVANPDVRLLKVPDGLMMEGGGPPAVKAWVYEQIHSNTFTPLR
ncbi:hypothetical protein BJY59DRAFT_381756 [Rhodotorula toruloides]